MSWRAIPTFVTRWPTTNGIANSGASSGEITLETFGWIALNTTSPIARGWYRWGMVEWRLYGGLEDFKFLYTYTCGTKEAVPF
jgi:hypothetical protein